MLARACVAVIALVVLGWLAIMERDTRLQARYSAAVRPGESTAQMASAERDLRAARLLNPDAQTDIDLA